MLGEKLSTGAKSGQDIVNTDGPQKLDVTVG